MAKKFVMKSDLRLPSKAVVDLGRSKVDEISAARAFTRGVLAGSQVLESKLPAALDRSMSTAIWGPFNPKFPYYRQNGDVAASGLRDIVDTGKLRDSLSLKTTFLKTKVQTRITYSAPYARLVHEGGLIQPYGNKRAATVQLPARPWISSVLSPGSGPVAGIDIRSIYDESITRVWEQG